MGILLLEIYLMYYLSKGVLYMRKILIFTASIGGGHNEAASCLEKEFIKHGFTVKKIDILLAISKSLDSFISSSCKIIINNFPKLYGNLYDISNKEKTNKLLNMSLVKVAKEKIYNIILEETPDLIISTHSFPISIVGYLKEKNLINVPFISVITDYEAHKIYVNDNVDAYIVGSDHTGVTLFNQGIPENRIFPYGIPIKTEFLNRCNKMLLNKKPFQILLMAGSLGLKNMIKVLDNVMTLEGDYRVVVVCGNNKKLRLSIESEFTDWINNNKIILYGFTNNIPDIMESSDILITKPGGLTISEAMAKRLPMIIPYYIPGQEKENLDFLVKNGLAIYVYKIKEIKNLIEYLMNNPRILDNMKENMEKTYSGFSNEGIVYLGKALIEYNSYDGKLG